MSAPNLRGAQPPPVTSDPEYDVVGLPPQGWQEVLFLGDMIWGMDCHWIADPKPAKTGHSERCTKNEGECALCGVHRAIWLGWTPAILLGRKQRVVYRMGPETYRAIARFAGRLISWHGLACRLAKARKGLTAGAVIEAYDRMLPVPIPHPHSMRATLMRVLRTQFLPDFHLDVDEAASTPLSAENGGAA